MINRQSQKEQTIVTKEQSLKYLPEVTLKSYSSHRIAVMVTHRGASRRLKLPLFQSPSTAVFSTQNWTFLALRPSADDDFSGILPIKIKYIISLRSDIHKYRVDQ